jgi:cytoskeletal protein RodZ
METLGVWLRQTRETRDEMLSDVQAATRIKTRFLEMLEDGEFDAFPGGEVQVRGFLRIYARHLDLPLEDVLSRYEKEKHRVAPVPAGVSVEPQPARQVAGPVTPQPSATPVSSPGIPEWLSLEMIVIACIVLIIVLVILIAVLVLVGQSREAGGLLPALTPATVLADTSPLPTATALTASTPTFPASAGGDVTLTLKATEHVWVRVTVDGITAFEGILAKDQTVTESGREVIVDTGNGAGLQVIVNGQLQGVMSGRGEVCSRAWGPTGEIVAP